VQRTLPIALVAIAALAVAAPGAVAHQGNPDMESVVRAIRPHTDGLSIQVLDRDDRFELTNRSGRTITILGYDGEAYARMLPDGTVEQNTSSPAYYLNQDREATVDIPKGVSADSAPTWKVLDKTGRLQWHDHRMHYMGKGVPPTVKDTTKRQKVNDYTIPIRIGARNGAILGTLLWTPPDDGGPPTGAIVAFAVLLAASIVVVVVTRRRRARSGGAGDGPAAEVW
jgi:hypothetical protein